MKKTKLKDKENETMSAFSSSLLKSLGPEGGVHERRARISKGNAPSKRILDIIAFEYVVKGVKSFLASTHDAGRHGDGDELVDLWIKRL